MKAPPVARSDTPPPARHAALERGARDTAARGTAAPGLLGSRPAGPRALPRSNLAPLGSASGLPPALQRSYERRLGVDLDGVRLHRGAAAAEAAQGAGADALAVGDDIMLGAGKGRPDSAEGRELLLHELAHVAQHRTGQANGETLRDGPLKQGIGRAPPEGEFYREEGAGPETQHVLFEHDGASLDAADMNTLRDLAASQTGAVIIDVYGYSSAEGDPEYNMNLSAHRAMRVKQALESLLPPTTVFSVHARGQASSFGPPLQNRRVGINVRPSTVQMGAIGLLGHLGRRPSLLGGDLRFRLDPTLLLPPTLSEPEPRPYTLDPSGPAVRPAHVPSPFAITGIGGAPPLGAGAVAMGPAPGPVFAWNPALMFVPQRPQGVRADDFDMGPLALAASSRGVTLMDGWGASARQRFLEQTDGLMRLGFPPWLAGYLAQRSIEKAFEYRMAEEHPNFMDHMQREDEIRGTAPHTLEIDLLKVPDYTRRLIEFFR
ncbi:eCIS core domain-containing protein [Caulobacter endophyticus]|uniref:eCIS core domain-containing protein n=1 Tax=Caulobacter endophyticus TaxID=2172652 RepID=UPI00240F9ECF|nr:DUF4157 domain-containing protein [Caulobacter endophyticus]MDG2527884.1 DUF4157 domain-containing protein [Caulobacter endophyticus]